MSARGGRVLTVLFYALSFTKGQKPSDRLVHEVLRLGDLSAVGFPSHLDHMDQAQVLDAIAALTSGHVGSIALGEIEGLRFGSDLDRFLKARAHDVFKSNDLQGQRELYVGQRADVAALPKFVGRYGEVKAGEVLEVTCTGDDIGAVTYKDVRSVFKIMSDGRREELPIDLGLLGAQEEICCISTGNERSAEAPQSLVAS